MMSTSPPAMRPNRIIPLSKKERSAALYRRQALLLERAAAQRTELVAVQAGLEGPLSWMRKGLGVIRTIRSHPQIALLSVLAASLTFGRQASKARNWAVRGLALHQLYKVLASGLSRAGAAVRAPSSGDSSLLHHPDDEQQDHGTEESREQRA